MESSLSQAYYDVYSSSKQILKNNQRHLFCNMLELLSSTCTTSAATVIGKKLSIDDLSHFWMEDILPLAFDRDTAIQNRAVVALEQGLLALQIVEVHGCAQWTKIKNAVIGVYAPRIHKLRESRNSNWCRIWCLLVRMLDREILKGASTINSFLSIVELGFRSSDSTVRAEAFSCWRVLIQLFNEHDQLSSPKRLKLLCIPLKSSQSKTPYGAALKFRVWWFLITCLGSNLDQHFEAVVEPFYTFCLGTPTVSGAVQKYDSVRELALPCLTALMLLEPCHFLEQLLRERRLEILCLPSSLVNRTNLQKHWKSIGNAAAATIRLLIQEEAGESNPENRLINILLKSCIKAMVKSGFAPLFDLFCHEFKQILPESSRVVVAVVNMLTEEGLRLSCSLEDIENYTGIITSVTQLLIAARSVVTSDLLQRCVNQVFNLSVFQSSTSYWLAVNSAADLLLRTKEDEGYDSFSVKLWVWCRVSKHFLSRTKYNVLGCSLEDYCALLYRWIVWPLHMCVEFARGRDIFHMDKSFCDVWMQLMQLEDILPGQTQHLSEVCKTLSAMLAAGYEELVITNLLDPYAEVVMKFNLHANAFQLLVEALKKHLTPKTMEACLGSFLKMLRALKLQEASSMLELIMEAIELIVCSSQRREFNVKMFDKWKYAVFDSVRLYPKEFVDQVTEILNSSDVFVIIPSVWSLNPDKLTERQKERFAEKTNIPALYNDMSQSQDSSIRAWTPKKIVIAKENQDEIVLEGPCLQARRKTSNEVNFQNSFDSLVTTSKNQQAQHDTASLEYKDPTSGSNQVHNTWCEGDKSPIRQLTNLAEVKEAQCYGDLSESNIISIVKDDASNKVQQHEAKNFSGYEGKSSDKNGYLEDIPSIDVERNSINQASENHMDLNLTKFSSEAISNKEVSPKKVTLKATLLSSPPDRKLTSNSSSPKLRPKPSAHLTGRGAQFINMIRNKKADVPQSTQTSTAKSAGKCEKIGFSVANEPDLCTVDLAPLQMKDMLTFSKRLPSPSASPSTSILKRTSRRDSMEETFSDSPAYKKKRVSFHDPVAITKEYVKHFGENKSKPKRCLMMDKVITTEKGLEARHALTRRSKLDSITEIEKFSSEQNKNDAPSVIPENNISYMKPTTVENSSEEIINSSCHEACPESYVECKDVLISSKNAISFVLENYCIDEILEKYLSTENDSQTKSIIIIAKVLSRYMIANSKVKRNILEMFSESHSKEFLDHAIRENLASVVCDRLNLPSVIEYVCEKSKANSVCRNNLFLQIPEILKHYKHQSERIEFVKTIFENIDLKDDNILDLITDLVKFRTRNSDHTTNVSESAIDSSSNL